MLIEPLSRKTSFRPDEVAEVLRLSRRTVYRMIRDGRLPAFRLGLGPWRIRRRDLVASLSSGLFL